MKFRTALPLALVFSLGAVAPVHADALKPSKADQVKLGKKAAEDIRKKAKIVSPYDERVRLLRRVGNRLVSEMDLRNEPWQFSFDMIEDKSINAFALPGGPIFFNSGLVDRVTSEDELAAVLAHEITHVRREHWAYAYADQQKRQLGLTALLLIFRPSRTVTDLLSISNDVLLSLPYSRRHELESDDQGLDLMMQAGYNPMAMADVFEMMNRESKGGKAPEFLSTHPSESNRIGKIRNKVNAMNRNFPSERPLPWYDGYDGRR